MKERSIKKEKAEGVTSLKPHKRLGKTITPTNPETGITVKSTISLSVENKKSHELFRIIALFITAFLGCFGTIYGFINMFSINLYGAISGFFFMVFFLFFASVFVMPKKGLLLLLPAFAVYEYLLSQNWELYITGFQHTVNKMFYKINDTTVDYFTVSDNISKTDSVTVFFIFSSFIMIMLICYFSISRNSSLMSIFVTFPLVEIGLYNGFSPAYPYMFMIIAFWVASYVLSNSSYNEYAGKSPANFVRKGNNFYSKPNIKLKVNDISAVLAIAIAIIVLTASYIAVTLLNYQRSQNINDMRYNIKTAAEDFSWEDLKGSLENFLHAINANSVVNNQNGRINQNGNVKIKNRTDMIVTFDTNPMANVYLKNYVGSVYTGDSWDKLPDSTYKQYSEMFDSMKAANIYPQVFDMFMETKFTNPLRSINVNIEMTAKGYKSNFVPYNSLNQNNSFKFSEDTYISLPDKDNYQFEMITNSGFAKNDWDEFVTEADFEEYQKIQSQYADFVYQNYLTVPDNQYMDEIRNAYSDVLVAPENNDDSDFLMIMTSGISTGFAEGYSVDADNFCYYINGNQYKLDDHNMNDMVVLSQIKNRLSQDAVYSLSPGKTPGNRDYVNFFLMENHKGYCEHFASAGVILARMASIPARYVEGYVVPMSEITSNNRTENGNYRVEVKDNLAHAWAEVYVNGCWQPFEFTPGYSNGTTPEKENESLMTSESTSNDETKKPSSSESSSQRNETRDEPNRETNTSTSSTSETSKSSGGSSYSLNRPNASLRNSVTYAVIIILAILIIAVAALAIRRKYANSEREKAFLAKSAKTSTVNAYNYIINLLDFDGISSKNMQHLEFAEFAENNTGFFEKGEFLKAVSIALKASMSSHSITEEEHQYITELALRLAHDIYAKQTKLRKLYMMYISNLI